MDYYVKEIKGSDSIKLQSTLNNWSKSCYEVVSINYIEKYFKWVVVFRKK